MAPVPPVSVAVNVVDVVPLAQMVGCAATALTLGFSKVTVTVLLAVHPLASVVVTVYVVVEVGLAVGLCTMLELRLAEGLHA